MNVFALFGGSALLEEGGEMFVEVDGPAFREPVRQAMIVREKNHQLYFLLSVPVLVLEVGFLFLLLLALF